MTGLDNIIEHIKNDASESINGIIQEANKIKDDTLSEYRDKASKEVDVINKRLNTQLKSISDRTISSSEIQKKRIELSCRQELIKDTIEKAKEHLINLPDKEYIDFLKKVYMKNIPSMNCSIKFNEKDKKRIGQDILDEFVKLAKEKGATLTISKDTCNIRSGFMLDFGNVIGNCSFESLIDQNIEKLTDKVNSILFN